MPASNTVFQTVTCDGPTCDKSVVIEASDPAATQKTFSENPWVRTARHVMLSWKVNPQGQPEPFIFCSDVCLVNAATAGMFEEKKIIPPEGTINAQIKAALEAKLREKQADAALRAGAPVSISQKQA